MKRVVVDASVVIKWLFPHRDREENPAQAVNLLKLVRDSRVKVHQPPHWLAEAAAVIARLSPETALEDIRDLYAMEYEILDTLEVYMTACKLAVDLHHHLFDTLYHAVALNLPDAMLVTADEQYYQKAHFVGCIVLLEDFRA